MLKARETLLGEVGRAGFNSSQTALLSDVIDSAWQWRNKEVEPPKRERIVNVGGQRSSSTVAVTQGQTGPVGPIGPAGPIGPIGPAGSSSTIGYATAGVTGVPLGDIYYNDPYA